MVLDGTILASYILPAEDRHSCRYRTVGVIGGRSVGKSTLIDLFCAVCPFCAHEQGRDLVMGAGLQEIDGRGRTLPAGKGAAGTKKAHTDDEAAASSQGWAINRHTSPKSLKWFCRQAVLKHNIPYDASMLPGDLVDYINAVRRTVCLSCETVAVKYHSSTKSVQRFHKLVKDRRKSTLGVLMVDWPEYPSFEPVAPDGDAIRRIESLLLKSLESWVIVYDLLRAPDAALDTALSNALRILDLNTASPGVEGGTGAMPAFVILGTRADLIKNPAILEERTRAHRERVASSAVAQKGARIVYIACSLRSETFNAAHVFDQALSKDTPEPHTRSCGIM